ncbi:hypothetical protein FJTKL_07534 [Diaporthe vaccinii]|uniref:Uncharacterized protein n=1 Tax=Diaporthe vaccinii TaxID=105482 RepID=A0ABR4ETP4_9PEZI
MTPSASHLALSTSLPPSPPSPNPVHQYRSPSHPGRLEVVPKVSATTADNRALPAYGPRHSRRPVSRGQHRPLTGFYSPLHGRRKTLGAGASCSTGARHIVCVVARLGVQG